MLVLLYFLLPSALPSFLKEVLKKFERNVFKHTEQYLQWKTPEMRGKFEMKNFIILNVDFDLLFLKFLFPNPNSNEHNQTHTQERSIFRALRLSSELSF